MLATYAVPVVGALIYGVLIFQFLVGRRIIHFAGKRHMQVHRATAWVLLVAAPLHGLLALHVFFAWPF
jgi:hypothetical protein